MSEVVADFIYQTANPLIKEFAKTKGHQAYINSFNNKKNIPGWKEKYENLMENYQGTKFTFNELETWVTSKTIQDRYLDITVALYESLRPHYH